MPVKKGKKAGTAAKKQSVHHDESLLVALSKPLVIKPYHHKPYRVRHLGVLVLAVILLLAATLQVGRMLAQKDAPSVVPSSDTTQSNTKSTLTTVRSGYGFSFAYDNGQFDAEATAIGTDGTPASITRDRLRDGSNINSLTLKPFASAVAPTEAASRMTVQVNPDATLLAKTKSQSGNASLSDGELAAKVFPVEAVSNFDITTVSSTKDTLNGLAVQKTIYQYTPKFAGGNVFAIVWTGAVNDRPFVIRLQSLVGSAVLPAAYQSIFDTLDLSSNQKVEGLSTVFSPKVLAAAKTSLDPKYQSDLISPAVVKIYRLYCGDLVVDGADLTGSYCDGVTGSGFILTSNGYVGTNGHVVDVSAKNAFVTLLVQEPDLMPAYLRHKGLTDSQIQTVLSSKEGVAAIIAKIFAEPDTNIAFQNYKDVTFVALGDEPLKLESESDIKTAIDQPDTEKLKKATIVGTNYSAADAYAIELGQDGFKSSDVALIKMNVTNAPTVAISTSTVTQSQKITVIGFPGDADNELVSTDKLSITATNGSISSIREAAGDSGRLYQTDADASHGNSGGPAIDDQGTVIGLLTYRFQDDDPTNAAKSYIRDIADLSKLAADKKVDLNPTSTTQTAWKQGLTLISSNHYSKAVKQFNIVKANYPADRLVDQYIASSAQAIKDGKDVKDFPIAIVLVVAVIALVGAGIAVFFIVRHHGKHQVYKAAGQPGFTGPVQPGGVVGAMVTPVAQPAVYAQPVTPVAPAIVDPQPVVAPIAPQPDAAQSIPVSVTPSQTIIPEQPAPDVQVVQPVMPQQPADTQPTIERRNLIQ